MKRKRVIACVLASAFVLSQLTSVSYAAEDVNGSVYVYSDGSASVHYADGTHGNVSDGEVGSVTNTSGGAAVTVSTDTDGPDNAEKSSFTIDGSVSSDDSAADKGSSGDSAGDTDGSGDSAADNTVTGIQVGEYAGGGDVAETTLNVTGDVTAEMTQEGTKGASGIDVELAGDNTIDKSVTVNTGDVTVKVTSGDNGSIVRGVDYSRKSDGQSSADQEPASTTVTVNTGNVTVSRSSESGSAAGIHIDQGSADVKVNVEGDVTVTGSVAEGVEVTDHMDGVAEVSISGDLKVSAAGGEETAYGVLTGSTSTSYVDDDHSVITIGGDISAEGGSAFGIATRDIPNQRGTVKVGGNITAAAEAEEGTAAAIQAQTHGVTTILVGGNASATGNDSAGINLRYSSEKYTETEAEHPGRIEVLGTVSGGTGDIVLSLDDKKSEYGQPDEFAPAETVKADLEAEIPTIVTHKLENNSIVVKAESNNQETMEAAAGILKDKILYTVNYTAKVSNENGQEDGSLGTIEITKFDGLQLDQEKLQTTGETVYVAKAGEVIKINIKATDKTTTENKKLVENNKTTTWTETTSYEIDLDKLDGNVSGGKDYVLKAEKKENGEVIYTLEVKQGGGVDIDVNSIIRAIVTKSNEKTVTNDSSDGSDSSDSSGSGSSGSGSSGSGDSGSVNYTPSTTYYIGSGGGSWQYVDSYHDPSGYPGSDYSYTDDEYQSAAEVEGVWGYDPNQGYYQSQSSGGSWQSLNGSNSGNDSNSGNANKAGRTWWRWKDNDQYGAAKKAGWKKLLWGDRLDWYFFDKDSYMRAGFVNWDGNRYFLNPISDGYRGRMLIGYQKINGNDYYFEEKEGPFQGRMYRNEGVPDGRIAGPDGVIR